MTQNGRKSPVRDLPLPGESRTSAFPSELLSALAEVAEIASASDDGVVAVRNLVECLRLVDADAATAVKYRALAARRADADAARRVPFGADRPAVDGPRSRDGVQQLWRPVPVETALRPILAAESERALEEILLEHAHTGKLRRAGLEPRRSLLLTGPPGVGKTTAARWLAHRLGLPLMEANIAAIVSSYLGRTAQNLAEVFAHARAEPVVLFLDEFDAVSKQRDDAQDIGEMKRTVSALLLELDRPPAHGMVVAATNHPQLVDPAAFRRFQAHVPLKTGTSELAQRIFEHHLGQTLPARTSAAIGGILHAQSGAAIRDVALSARRRAALHGDELSFAALVEASRFATTTQQRRTVARSLRDALGDDRASMSFIASVLGCAKSTVHDYLKGAGGNSG